MLKNKIIYGLSSFCLILFIMLEVVDLCCFDINFYNSEHNKLTLDNKPIAEYIGINEKQLEDITKITLNYLKDRDLTLDYKLEIKGEYREVFNDDEKAHMVDVRELYLNAMSLKWLCLAIFILGILYLFLSKDKIINYIDCYKKILMIYGIIILFLVIFIIIDFDSFWTSFHHIFFSSNDLWLLDLRTDVLIMIVPPTFFFHLVSKIVYTFIFIVLLITLLLEYLRKKANDSRCII